MGGSKHANLVVQAPAPFAEVGRASRSRALGLDGWHGAEAGITVVAGLDSPPASRSAVASAGNGEENSDVVSYRDRKKLTMKVMRSS
jgi:hypothetical protein